MNQNVNVAALRASFKLSQAKFAALLGISIDTLQNWEQKRREPDGPAKVLLRLVRAHPEALLAPEPARVQAVAEVARRYDVVAKGLPHLPGLGPSRHAQLVADLKLTPEARVRVAEETARAVPARGTARVHRVIGFDRYADYLDWKQRPHRDA